MAVTTTNLGVITAYGDAVAAGYTGTKAEWQALMASYATVGQQAVNAKNDAVAAKNTAVDKATEATTAANTATTKAGEANASAQSIAQSAAQIQENTDDISELKNTLSDVKDELNYDQTGKIESYIDFRLYGAKKTGLPTIDAVTSDAITISATGSYKGVKYAVPMKRNTNYVVNIHAVGTGPIFFDVTDADESVQIVYATGITGNDLTLTFNSGSNDIVCFRPAVGNSTATITYSNLWYSVASSPTIDNTLHKTGYSADARAVGDRTAVDEVQSASNTGFMNVWNGALSYTSGSGWEYSDYIRIPDSAYIAFDDLWFYCAPNNSIMLAIIAFFDESKTFISAFTNFNAVPSTNNNGKISGVIKNSDIPTTAKYFRYTARTNEANRQVKVCVPVNIVTKGILTKLSELKIYGFDKKINIIGDSISQGVGSVITYDDSYAGVLRKMFMIEADLKMNYGFEPFPSLTELATVEETMVTKVSSSGFTRTWNGATCYGNDEYASSTVGATLVFTVNKDFKYMRISYKEGVTGSFAVKVGNTTLATITSTSGTASPAMSNAIDISEYGISQEYTIEVISGSVTVSGVELGEDTDYPTFNNYGRAGIAVGNTKNALLTAEANCDVLIYALGTNGAINDSDVSMLTTALGDSPANTKLILDLCVKSTQRDSTGKSSYLQEVAQNIGALYLRMYDIIPKDSSGYTDADYLLYDGVHPSELGHRCIVDAVARILKLSVKSKGLASSVFTLW